MANTPNLGSPTYEGTDPPAGHTQEKALADHLDVELRATRCGVRTVNLNNEAVKVVPVTFASPFPAGRVPVVVATTDIGLFNAAAKSITHLGFDLTVRQINSNNATQAVVVGYVACLPLPA